MSPSRSDHTNSVKFHSITTAAVLLIAGGQHVAAQALSDAIGITDGYLRGKELAKTYCAGCHLQPRPDIADKETWKTGILPWMKIILGLNPEQVDTAIDSELIKQSGAVMTSPAMTLDVWNDIIAYYIEEAPEIALPPYKRPEIEITESGFTPKPQRYGSNNPMAFTVHIDSPNKQIFVSDGLGKEVDILDNTGKQFASLAVGNLPAWINDTPEGLYITSLGQFWPREIPAGALHFAKREGNSFATPELILDKLQRPAHTSIGDLNGDGREDLVISMFGNYMGHLSWFQKSEAGDYEEHVIYPKAGALKTELRDLDNDGDLDIATLISQAEESFFIYWNDGIGNFTATRIFQHQPAFGHTFFEMVDFDKDGDLDIIATNGDNGEFNTPPRRFHGIRIYLNDGNNEFRERYFFPMSGAFKALARDFDGDGDLDIAAVSFFPDYKTSPRESFVLLTNQGDYQFTPATIKECIAGRWITLDAGDIDGDEDIDLVLGAVKIGPRDVPPFLAQAWNRSGLTTLVLENTFKAPKSPPKLLLPTSN